MRPASRSSIPLSRRSVLRTAAVAPAAALLVAGCDGDPGKPGASTSRSGTGLRFPPNFKWGVATSAYQIEGAAATDGRGPSIWDTFSHGSGHVRGGDTGDVAADHYHRYVQDLDLMKSLGVGSYRFSLSWSRILPTGRGAVNQRGLDFYKRLVDGLRQRNIAPVATLFHWDLPQALQDAGGWESRDCANWFADYAAIAFRALGDTVSTWTTINEPKTVVQNGYTSGVHAPGLRDPNAAQVAGHHLLLAHGLAVGAFRAAGGKRIGPVLNLCPVYPSDPKHADDKAVAFADAIENRVYLDPIFKGVYPEDFAASQNPNGSPVCTAIKDGDLKIISSPIDILGVNYYSPVFVSVTGSYETKQPTTAATWAQIYPQGLTDTLLRVKRDYGDIAISICENGAAYDDTLEGDAVHDPKRTEYLQDHIAAVHQAISKGVRVESYHLWSLLDNFEWSEGYRQRWGIVYVDFATQQRVLKDSAKWYRKVITRNGT